jgi:hypothetical protein
MADSGFLPTGLAGDYAVTPCLLEGDQGPQCHTKPEHWAGLSLQWSGITQSKRSQRLLNMGQKSGVVVEHLRCGSTPTPLKILSQYQVLLWNPDASAVLPDPPSSACL